ncbi:AraC family transcriptional regulator [Streptomyces albireticuli]|uniref:AraC family transcriptional regulator n=1 Tax=Streptomyces albireticuli TaxID=1940 RepID=UPI001E4389FA|nr:helix-turn-helix transcriptional regulator [Streptomyces albireticuli]MCD9142709.1 helix-turn-helix transcriptional regulator [Streptomyces albireticuli]MCD9162972.1 helix-turn-helix transcriptional regulator [Streptomyces albireticuli]MCD9192837.1 helix-turn-helix transcriptional regulator [Streptomyces albireticuli]
MSPNGQAAGCGGGRRGRAGGGGDPHGRAGGGPSQPSHGHLVAPLGSAIAVGSFPLDGGEWFARHEHGAHQLAWAPHGVLAVRATGRTWVLPSTVALWIPAGVPHATGATSAALLRSLYFWPDRCPVSWDEPRVVAVSGLLRELIGHLAQGADRIPADARLRAESVVLDLLRPVSVTTVRAPDPADPRARRVAEALRADPSDGRTLTEWGTVVGASARTLARAFVSDTGLTYGQWRTQLRLQAAMPLLAAGATVSSVARRVGYGSASAFVAAFRRGVGVAPGTYFARAGGEGVGR